MSHYTTELRYFCEVYSGQYESKGYMNVLDIISRSRQYVFNFVYPLFDANYKSVLETKIIKHYYTREICAETFGLWQLWLDARMNEIMPYYNKLYQSEILTFDPLKDYDITKEGNKEVEGNTTNSGRDVLTTNESGTSETDVTHGGTDSLSEQDEPHNDRWDLFSDTPQGNIIAMTNDEYRYLTDARHITESGAGSNRDATTTYGQTINTDGEYANNSTATTQHGKITDATTTEEYLEHISGKISGVSYSKLLMEYRDTFINIDMMIIKELADLFFNLW